MQNLDLHRRGSPGAKGAKVITRDVEPKQTGTFWGIAIDQGGCAETSRPTTRCNLPMSKRRHPLLRRQYAGGMPHRHSGINQHYYRYVELRDLGLDGHAKAAGADWRDRTRARLTYHAVAEAHGLKYDAVVKLAEMHS
jgi:hypothetical protein